MLRMIGNPIVYSNSRFHSIVTGPRAIMHVVGSFYWFRLLVFSPHCGRRQGSDFLCRRHQVRGSYEPPRT